MTSNSLRRWRTKRAQNLDEMENAHASIGGTGRGRRYATQQVNQAYAVMVASQFQGFCRDLHSESVEALMTFLRRLDIILADVNEGEKLLDIIPLIRRRLVDGRQLDSKNARPGSLGADFGWFGMDFWGRVDAVLGDAGAARKELENLNDWRNAIAHQDFKKVSPNAEPKLTLRQVRKWRRGCDRLARAFDRVMEVRMSDITGKNPWL